MKIYFAVCFVFIANVLGQALSDDTLEKVHKMHLECAKTSGIDETTIKKLEDAAEYPEDDKIRVHTKCVMRGIGMMDDEGKVDVKTAASILKGIVSDGKEKDIVKKCFVEKDGAGDTAFLIGKCIFTEVHALRM